jgi:hypothetical protein
VRLRILSIIKKTLMARLRPKGPPEDAKYGGKVTLDKVDIAHIVNELLGRKEDGGFSPIIQRALAPKLSPLSDEEMLEFNRVWHSGERDKLIRWTVFAAVFERAMDILAQETGADLDNVEQIDLTEEEIKALLSAHL